MGKPRIIRNGVLLSVLVLSAVVAPVSATGADEMADDEVFAWVRLMTFGMT